MVDLDLRPERRAALVDSVAEVLAIAVPGSRISLRGSLATGEADQFSDIDLLWVVPGDRFTAAVAGVRETLASVSQVSSVRSDPEFQGSGNRRLLFIQLADLPLFWRIDLEVRSPSEFGPGGPVPVVGPLLAAEWSAAASAAANAVATIKAVARGHLVDARGLLERGFDRMGETFDPSESWTGAVVRLARSSAAADPNLATYGQQVANLADVLLSMAGSPNDPVG
ncbi:MAG TPA: nucleotidyltransferase domain-containing protein [Acidimicrobiales bacterium]|nr:nucleotidyltransferase domain-containing protein [Acidimicrobiales bacterium]